MTQRLIRLPLRAPGVEGLNLEGAQASFDSGWALQLNNAVFDKTGRIAAREGWVEFGTSHGEDVITITEFEDEVGIPSIIHSTTGGIYEENRTTYTSFTDITGTASGGNWQFATISDAIVGARQGQTMIFKTKSGASFAPIVASSGTVPQGDVVISAFSRLWGIESDRKTIKWCAIDSYTDWAGAGSGTIDMRVFTRDVDDIIIGMIPFQSRLVVFMSRHIVTFINVDDPGAAAPAGIQAEDVIPNIGLAGGGRDTVISVGNDIIFASSDGLRSLSRALQSSDRLPMSSISTQVKEQLETDIGNFFNTDYPYMKAAFTRRHGFYFLQTGTNYWMFDLQRPTPDGNLRASRWFSIGTQSCYEDETDELWLGINGGLAKYGGYLDGTEDYEFRYKSPYIETTDGGGFIAKSATATVMLSGMYDVNFTTSFDFSGADHAYLINVDVGDPDEWGLGEWGLSEWSGSVQAATRVTFDLGGEGERIQLGLSLTISGNPFSFQSIDVSGKRGRLAA